MVGDAVDLEILEYLSCGTGAISFTKIPFKFWWMELQSLVIFFGGRWVVASICSTNFLG